MVRASVRPCVRPGLLGWLLGSVPKRFPRFGPLGRLQLWPLGSQAWRGLSVQGSGMASGLLLRAVSLDLGPLEGCLSPERSLSTGWRYGGLWDPSCGGPSEECFHGYWRPRRKSGRVQGSQVIGDRFARISPSRARRPDGSRRLTGYSITRPLCSFAEVTSSSGPGRRVGPHVHADRTSSTLRGSAM